jgi:hypothetical protein
MSGTSFDRCYVSEYYRAIETAYFLGISEEWCLEFYLREREWGVLDVMPDDERKELFSADMDRRERNLFYFCPTGGESMASICSNRIDRMLDTLHRECDGKNVIIVCHGEVMDAFVTRLERIKSFDYDAYHADPTRDIRNGQIIHYTRVDPLSTEVKPYLGWYRMWWPVVNGNNADYRCLDREVTWNPIVRKKYTRNELKNVFERQPRQVND